MGLDDEDAPQVAGIIDERPEHLREMDKFKASSKWRVIAQNDGTDSRLRVEEIERDEKKLEEENNIEFGKMYSDSEDEKRDSDQSPPRNNEKMPASQNKQKTERKKEIKNNRSDSDISPPRSKKTKNADDSDQSPPRKAEKQKHDEKYREGRKEKKRDRYSDKKGPDSDLSPPRNRNKPAETDSDQSPPRRAHRKDKDIPSKRKSSDSDLSPPRNRERDKERPRKASRWGHFPPENMSSKGENTSESKSKSKSSPKLYKRKSDSESDLSPPRKSRKELPKRNLPSPPRNTVRERKAYESHRQEGRKETTRYDDARRNRDSPPPSNKKMARTLEGKTAGLQDARGMNREAEEFRRREDELYSKMAPDVSGRDATTVNRRLGKRETSAEREKNREKQQRQKEMEMKYGKWGRGLKQVSEQEERARDFAHEASKPFARAADDADLELTLRAVERAGDPMLDYLKGKKETDVAERPTYKGNWPPNRFNIRPGYRWDGVDRSNGYEKKYFDHKSKAKAMAEEAYKWSTEDL